MKNLVLVAFLLSVVSLPAFAQNKFIKEANTKLTVTEASAPVQVEKGKQVEQEKQANEREAAADATGEAATEAPATGEAATDADAATGETATDAATGEPATDAAAGQEKSEVEQ